MDNVSRRVEEEVSYAFACVAGNAESMNVHLNDAGAEPTRNITLH